MEYNDGEGQSGLHPLFFKFQISSKRNFCFSLVLYLWYCMSPHKLYELILFYAITMNKMFFYYWCLWFYFLITTMIVSVIQEAVGYNELSVDLIHSGAFILGSEHNQDGS